MKKKENKQSILDRIANAKPIPKEILHESISVMESKMKEFLMDYRIKSSKSWEIAKRTIITG